MIQFTAVTGKGVKRVVSRLHTLAESDRMTLALETIQEAFDAYKEDGQTDCPPHRAGEAP